LQPPSFLALGYPLIPAFSLKGGEGDRSAFGVRRFDVRPKRFAWLF
jgi:hypothetical protein